MSHEVVITGIGAVTATALGLEGHWQAAQGVPAKRDADAYSLKSFKPAPHLSDRRMLKAVSATDAIGLAAIEGLKKEIAFDPRPYAPERTGLYVGAPPASPFDNAFYLDAMEASRGPDGRCRLREFGSTAMSAMPMALLVGLPNNVLCYGSMIFDAKGPNSNYTSYTLGGHMALINGARRVRRGQLDMAVAGGFTAHSEAVHSGMLGALGVAAGEGGVADGAVFVSLETRAAAAARGAPIVGAYLGGAMASDGLGPVAMDEKGDALASAIRRALAEAGRAPHDVGLVLAGAMGHAPTDVCELSVLSRVFANERVCPAVGYSRRALGHLAEAGGLLEIGLAARIHAAGEVPPGLRPEGRAADAGFGVKVPSGRRTTLILRVSPWGESSAVVIGH